jgi:hypothetical protein
MTRHMDFGARGASVRVIELSALGADQRSEGRLIPVTSRDRGPNELLNAAYSASSDALVTILVMSRTTRAIVIRVLFVVGCSEQNVDNGTAGAAGAATGGGGIAGGSGSSGMSEGGLGGAGGGGAPNVAGSEGGGDSSVGGSGGGDGGDERAPDSAGFSWRTLPSLAKKRQNAFAAAVGQAMYVMGGLDESGMLMDVEHLDTEQVGWTAAPSLPSPQCCAAAGVLTL